MEAGVEVTQSGLLAIFRFSNIKSIQIFLFIKIIVNNTHLDCEEGLLNVLFSHANSLSS